MSVNALQQQGKDYYKRKEYAKALEFFDRAIGRLPSVQLLDHRAACHIKMDDLPAALKDAKKTIQLGREDPTGYLRAGKALLKMEKPSVALEIYSHGLKCVKRVGQGYEVLKKVHGDLQSRLAPPKSIDPLTVLPRELALIVFEYLSFRQVVAISRVSKQWSSFIRSEPDLWRHLDLTNARTKVKSAFISKCINTARNKLREVTLNNLYNSDKALAALTKYCPIEKMTMLQMGLQNQNLVDNVKHASKLRELRIDADPDLSLDTLASLLQICGRTLEVFEQNQQKRGISPKILQAIDAPRLKAFSVPLMSPVTDWDAYRKFAEASPQLQSFKLRENFTPNPSQAPIDFSFARQLTCVDLSVCRLNARYIILPPSLRTLRLYIFRIQPNNFFDPLDPILSRFYLPNLDTVELRISGIPMSAVMYGLGLSALHNGNTDPQSESTSGETYEHPSKLKSLSLSEIVLDDGFVGWSTSRLDELEHLAIRQPILPASADFLDSPAMTAVTDLRHLRSLDLSETTIDGAGVKKVVSGGMGTLQELTLNNCMKLSRDAVDWARSRGIKVEHTTTNMTSGKKVRYQ